MITHTHSDSTVYRNFSFPHSRYLLSRHLGSQSHSFFLSLSFSLSFFLSLSFCLFISLFLYHTLSLSLSLTLFLFLSLYITHKLSLSLSLSLTHSLSLSLSLSHTQTLSLSLSLSRSYKTLRVPLRPLEVERKRWLDRGRQGIKDCKEFDRDDGGVGELASGARLTLHRMRISKAFGDDEKKHSCYSPAQGRFSSSSSRKQTLSSRSSSASSLSSPSSTPSPPSCMRSSSKAATLLLLLTACASVASAAADRKDYEADNERSSLLSAEKVINGIAVWVFSTF
jgi:hypothetical protein